MKERMIERLKDFKKALKRLEEGINIEPSNEIIIDGVIQRFEFTFELAWKLVKDCLEYEGIEAKSPRSAIREGFKAGIISDGEAWIEMLVDRNKTSHIYDEEEAKAIYNKIKSLYLDLFRELENRVKKYEG
ncbi:nucleotidyltransferase substrate binding protein [Thermosediminibacter litoriperuensis]|uniref:Nucleotidyltransferase substrate binding protein (TIGR01987 family) n=1 Tax=Thermosediminibacter litoriperuensis TaxID=291989 RepID=A0A5S5AM48_9FIRM|nr:nucleotidyltransferase substrate binding protein [Thermosediminibacter litoriperuensis]TYP50918.1 nucleotidyltransferase substrate binding protein (TIGR01987 family) [Thermosediminibacter litoriperuensis]